MIQISTILNGLALGALLLVAPLAVRADDQDAVDYRKHIMNGIDQQAAAISMIVAKKAPVDHFATHAKTLAISTGMAKKAFEPKMEGGDSKPQVWANWDDFSKRMDALVAASDDLAKTAASGSVAASGAKLQAVMATCKGCHDQYMTPKKSP